MKFKYEDLFDVYDYYFLGVIYKITNLVNNKIYIGKTKKHIKNT